MDLKHIRNFSIIAHIDHGKSTLADRMLEVTKTIDKRKMQDRILDNMELEKERGITIKMRPVRMEYSFEGQDYILNLIDTPGHIDFSYEVSRALEAVEGSILLVDATQGVQAQTLTTLETAKKMGAKIIPVLSKVDSPLARIDEVMSEVCDLLDCDPSDILLTSGKTGEGVPELLAEVIKKVPAPVSTSEDEKDFRALIFDFQYSNHKGVVVFIRVLDGCAKRAMPMHFKIAGKDFSGLEVGFFKPDEVETETLHAGEIGYIVTGIKEPGIASVGDTIVRVGSNSAAIPGYDAPKPVVWASIFPESQDDFDFLRQALLRLKLSDASYTFEEESSGTLGRGFRCGFLGMLHLEIITERLRREFKLELVVTLPSITYRVLTKRGELKTIYSPALFPDHGEVDDVEEPWINMRIITPPEYVGDIMQILFKHEAIIGSTENLGSKRNALNIEMPLRELMRNFFDEIKSASSGYASLSYEIGEFKNASVTKLELLVAEEPVVAFTRIVSLMRVQEEAEHMVERLAKILPRQMFVTKIQAKSMGKIISSKTLSAMKKNVTAHMYGGDITRKMKLREKQKKGKKKMQSMAKVHIGQDIFLKMMRNND
ncbi:MAG: translation elongation factor 4 [Candidatus Pacebacteria bacterium]|nr:translation elongation factor 4 [Candidatus Paceibacterota bacterium]